MTSSIPSHSFLLFAACSDEFGAVSGSQWSDRGCKLVLNKSTPTLSVCECNHLTHFAILLSPKPDEVRICSYSEIHRKIFTDCG